MIIRVRWLGLSTTSVIISRFNEHLDEWHNCQQWNAAFTSWFGKRSVNSNLHNIFCYQLSMTTYILWIINKYCQNVSVHTVIANLLPFPPCRRVFWQDVKPPTSWATFAAVVWDVSSPLQNCDLTRRYPIYPWVWSHYSCGNTTLVSSGNS